MLAARVRSPTGFGEKHGQGRDRLGMGSADLFGGDVA